MYVRHIIFTVYNHCCRSRRSHEKMGDPTWEIGAWSIRWTLRSSRSAMPKAIWFDVFEVTWKSQGLILFKFLSHICIYASMFQYIQYIYIIYISIFQSNHVKSCLCHNCHMKRFGRKRTMKNVPTSPNLFASSLLAFKRFSIPTSCHESFQLKSCFPKVPHFLHLRFVIGTSRRSLVKTFQTEICRHKKCFFDPTPTHGACSHTYGT